MGLKIQECRFHSCLDVRRPKFFSMSAARFWSQDSLFRVPTDPFSEETTLTSHKARTGKKRKKCKCHLDDQTKFAKWWANVIGILGLVCLIIGLMDLRTK